MLLYQEIKDVCNNIDNIKYKKKQINSISRFKKEWIQIMALTGLYNKKLQTYSLNNIKIVNYGIVCDIYIVPPLTFNELNNKIDILQENLGCMILLNRHRFSPFIKAKFIYNPQDDKKYSLISQKYPWEIYIGNDYSGKPILVDVNKYVHIGEYGGTRSGKSVQQSVILTNLIANISPNDVNLYLCQIAKADLILFSRCEHTKAFAHTLEETLTVLDYIVNIEMPRRDKLIEPYRECAKASNYKDYNKLKSTEKMVLSYVVFDETSSLFQEQNKEKKAIKDKIVFYMEEISRYGASLGFVLLVSLQRPTKDNMSTMVKSQCTTVISFRQNNQASSRIAIDDDNLALGLEQREFVYRLASKDVEYGIVPWVTDIELEQIIKPFKKPHRTLFDDIKKMNSRSGVKKDKKLIEVGTHIKTENEILQENISKINDFVPYKNPTGLIIRDETKLSSKTQKPIKDGKVKIK